MKTNSGATDLRDVRSKKKKARRILRPDEKQKSKETIPVGLPPFQRFYTALLRSEANEFLGQSKDVWKIVCDRLALPTVSSPLSPSYRNMKDHFSSRAALVIEEARQSLTDSIRLVKNDIENNRKRGSNKHGSNNAMPRHFYDRPPNRNQYFSSMDMSITRVEHKGNSGHSILTFAKTSGRFTKDELFSLRHGTIFVCLDGKASYTIDNIHLGVILPQNREEMVNSNSFVIMIFRKIKKTIKGKWKLTPIISLLSEQRKFEACLNQMATPVPFLLPLLGRKKPTHIRSVGDHCDDEKTFNSGERPCNEDTPDSDSDCEVLEVVDLEATFQIPRLNTMQEEAANAFLKSKSDTISLVQGPPGTGKTTLLTSVICRYIIASRKLEHNKRCLMVCAPTNKAVTVLCSRFLNTFLDDECPCNVVLIGDEDKLLENEIRNRENASENPRLRESFLYTFIDTIEHDYLYIRGILDKGNFRLFKRIFKISHHLEKLLKQKIKDSEVVVEAVGVVKLIEKFSKQRDKRYPTEIINKLDLIIGMIRAWNRDEICQEILQEADVIFCTLGSSGSSILRKVIGEVDDLIVDEAAAATEPEIYIPFQYLPRRLLCVGDPKQLPATITSQFAEEMGLSKSLHERLMYDCNYDHIMLDTQYRMKPALSEFPSQNFYEGKLMNGGNVVRQKYRASVSMMDGAPYTLYQINGIERQVRSGSIENEAEANAVVEIVDDLRRMSRNHSQNWCPASRLRIITFYQAQVTLIKRLLYRRNLRNVLVATVDSSQGCEADFVIVSFVRSEGKAGRSSVGFVADDRRLNVALTRAKYQMICLGNINRMAILPEGKAGSVKRLAIDAIDRKCVHEFPLFESNSLKRTRDENTASTSTNKRRKLPPLEIDKKCDRDPPVRINNIGNGNATNRANADNDSNASSESSSDSGSSVVSSSSSSSSGTSSSRLQHSRKLVSNFRSNDQSLQTKRSSAEAKTNLADALAPSMPATISEAVKCEAELIGNEKNPMHDENESVVHEETTTYRTKEAIPESIKFETDLIADESIPTSDNNESIVNEEAATNRTKEEDNSASCNADVVFSHAASNTDERANVQDLPCESRHASSSLFSKNETMAVFENFSF
mmetsp:Transcript_475/g.1221  ORF Transcript_475/g.1221 Transcript_475/m.1221 type:complete len:1117 (+) Transcript_475:151-3501(+)|eukprot:CAMPEP_0172362342 /NCGR_PEP_ID=MMETSP1060-20121228/5973_1 /TAXON_ID=37318 /ORGANISM="Pseudo-nitzschia pungens, Strain cf. cingulata" /LENGTH=1116 /DNA_ID=CAMNT_0013084831 /DNA_START=120 /DNA_END=3470 /DNA_ORIENTATION=-